MDRPPRVQPDGSFGEAPRRGQFMGNRGCLHDAQGAIRRSWAGKAWITCTLKERPDWGRHPFPVAGRWTPLFFLDEAVAVAAGHRPCALCRRQAYDGFRAAWARAHGAALAPAMDAVLHTARRSQRAWAPARDLPESAFFRQNGQAFRVADGKALPCLGDGYRTARNLPRAPVEVLTPAPMLAVLAQGWRPVLDAADDRPGW